MEVRESEAGGFWWEKNLLSKEAALSEDVT